MERLLDVRGIPCPQPVIKAKDAMKGMKEGDLVLLTDDEIAVQNLMKLGNFSNVSPVTRKLENGEYQVIFHLSEEHGEAPQRPKESEGGEICARCGLCQGQIVVLSSDCMGDGNDELGHILMKGFLYALTQLDVLPETVLLYNGGAKLSVEGSEAIGDLKNLEEQGVEILTCGTCLNYYNLSDKLAVGGVTNMYEIAEKLTAASAVIRP